MNKTTLQNVLDRMDDTNIEKIRDLGGALAEIANLKKQLASKPKTEKIKTNLFGDIDIIKIGDVEHFELSLKDFIGILPIYIQRSSENRLDKMTPIFLGCYQESNSSLLGSVSIGIAMNDFVDDESKNKVKKGDIYCFDANTRALFWRTNEKLWKNHANGLDATIHRLHDHTDVKAFYYQYNNKKSAESKAEVITGLIRKAGLKSRIKQPVFAGGMFSSALEYASKDVKKPKGKQLPSLEDQFKLNEKALLALDKLKPKTNSAGLGITAPAVGLLKSQPVIGGLLLALQRYEDNVLLNRFVELYCSVTEDELNNLNSSTSVNAWQMIALEYGRKYPASRPTGFLNGIVGNTRAADVDPQMDFVLYFISKYIISPNDTYNRHSMDTSAWKDAWKGWYADRDSVGPIE